MVSFTITTAAAAALLAASTSAAGNYPFFRAHAQVTQGPARFSGKYVTLYHTGAGENAATLTKNYTLAAQFQQYNGTYITMPTEDESGTEYYFLNLEHGGPTQDINGTVSAAAPKGYKYVSVNIGDANTPGFSINSPEKSYPNGTLEYSGSIRKFATFAACHVVDSLGGYGNGTQLLWRSSAVPADTTGQCADILVQTAFEE